MAIALSKLLIGLLHHIVACEGIFFAKDLLAEVVHPSKYFHSRRHCPVATLNSYQYNPATNKTKRTFGPRTRYFHIHLVCTSVHYERKMHVLIIRK